MQRHSGPLRAGDSVLFIDRKSRRYLRTLRAGAKISVRDGTVAADSLIGSCLGDARGLRWARRPLRYTPRSMSNSAETLELTFG